LELIRGNQTNIFMAFVRNRLTNRLAGGSGGVSMATHIIAPFPAKRAVRKRRSHCLFSL
jgi:hypothetical protein